MNKLTLVVLAAAGLALSGCSTDQPIFQSEASAQKAVNGTTAEEQRAPGASNEELTRELEAQQHSGATMTGNGGQADPSSSGSIQTMENNPYGH